MMDVIWQSRGDIQLVGFLLLALIAFWRGAEPERYCASTLVGVSLLDRVYHLLAGEPITFASVDLGHLGLDLSALVAFYLISISANRFYPLWLAAAQLISLGAHLSRELSEEIGQLAYALILQVPSYVQLLALAIGLYLHQKRIAKDGSYPSWRSSSGKS